MSEEKIRAVYKEMNTSNVWPDVRRDVAAFIVESDAKSDAAWAEYARARAAYALTMAEYTHDKERVADDTASLDAAKQALCDLGIDVAEVMKAAAR